MCCRIKSCFTWNWLKLVQNYFIIVSVMFYALLSYGGLLALFVSHYLLFNCQDFELLLFNVFIFVVIPRGPVLGSLLVFDFNFFLKLGFAIFDRTAPCYYFRRLWFDGGQFLFPLIYFSVEKEVGFNRLNRFHKIIIANDISVWYGRRVSYF
jgi:hypothetical protein